MLDIDQRVDVSTAQARNHVARRVTADRGSQSRSLVVARVQREFVVGPVGPEPVAILSHPSGVEINLILNAGEGASPNILMDVPEKHPGYTHVALAVDDLAAMQARLEAAGIALSGGPITFWEGNSSFFVRDPDRNVVEFNQNDGSPPPF